MGQGPCSKRKKQQQYQTPQVKVLKPLIALQPGFQYSRPQLRLVSPSPPMIYHSPTPTPTPVFQTPESEYIFPRIQLQQSNRIVSSNRRPVRFDIQNQFQQSRQLVLQPQQQYLFRPQLLPIHQYTQPLTQVAL